LVENPRAKSQLFNPEQVPVRNPDNSVRAGDFQQFPHHVRRYPRWQSPCYL